MIFFIIILAFFLRLINLNQSLWLDEAINIQAVQAYSLESLITKYSIADFHPPGYSIILWTWGRLFGFSEIAMRMPSVIFGIISVWLIYLIGKKLLSKYLGLMSAFLLAINPLHIYYSQEARMYSFSTFAVLINFFLLIKLLKKEKLNFIFLILSNYLVLMSDYVAYLIFPAQFILLLIFYRSRVKKWLISFAFSLLLSFWWLPIFIVQFDVGVTTASKMPVWRLVVGGFDIKAIPLTFVKFIIGRISLVDKFIYAIILIPITLLFSTLVIRGILFLRRVERNILIAWLFFPIILGALISFVIPIFSYFRFLFTLPSFIILVALGIISFRPKVKYILISLVILIYSISTLIYLFNPNFQRENWKGVVNFLKTKNNNLLVLFESNGVFPPFEYYAKGSIDASGALDNFPASSMQDLANLEEELIYRKDIYLIDYLVDISDPNRLVKEELEQSGYKITETHDFVGVGFLYHYVK